jgi:hypothetical protein
MKAATTSFLRRISGGEEPRTTNALQGGPRCDGPVKGINQSEVDKIALQIWLALTDAALMAGFGRCCAFLCELLSDIACVTL